MSATLLALLVPILTDLVKSGGAAITRKWIGLSVDDQIKLDTAQVEKLKALAMLDNPYGTPSQWVVDLRGAFRYVAAAVLLITGAGIAALGAYRKDPTMIVLGADIAGTPFAFIFGERMVLSYKGAPR